MRAVVVDVDAVGCGGDAPVAIGGGGGERGDVVHRLGERGAVVHLQQALGVAARQVGFGAGGEHQPAGKVVLGNRAPRMRAHLNHQHVADGELRANAEQHGGDAGAVGVGEFGQVAGAHQDLGGGQALAQRRVAQQRGGKTEMDGIEDRVEQTGDAARLGHGGGANQRVEVAGHGGDQHRHGSGAVAEVERVFGEAQQEVGACQRPAAEFAGVAGVDADRKALGLERADGAFEAGEIGARAAAEIDHVGAFGVQRAGAGKQRLGREQRRIDDLGENARIVARQVGPVADAAEMAFQVGEFVRTALERHAERLRKRLGVERGAAREDDTVDIQRTRQAAQYDRRGHQRRDFHADIERPGIETPRLEPGEQTGQPRFGQMAGQQQQAFSHGRPTRRGVRRWRRRVRPASARRASPRTRRARACGRGRCGGARP